MHRLLFKLYFIASLLNISGQFIPVVYVQASPVDGERKQLC